jgi:hypothetical protein
MAGESPDGGSRLQERFGRPLFPASWCGIGPKDFEKPVQEDRLLFVHGVA